MMKRLLLLTTLGVMLSGCYMVPMALVGPAVSGFSSGSILQASVSVMIKQGTGKSITEHALGTLTNGTLKQSYYPINDTTSSLITPKSKPSR